MAMKDFFKLFRQGFQSVCFVTKDIAFWLHNFFFAKELLQDWILFLFKFFLNWKKTPSFFERGDSWDVLKLTKKQQKHYRILLRKTKIGQEKKTLFMLQKSLRGSEVKKQTC